MRKLAASILTLAFLTLSAVPALGAVAVDQSKLKEIITLTQKMNSIKVQIIDKKVEAKVLDPIKAEKIKESMQKRQQRIIEDMEKGEFHDLDHKKGCCRKHSNDSPSPQKTE